MSRNGIIALVVVFAVGFLLLALTSRGYREVGAMQSMEAAMEAVRREHPSAIPISTEELSSAGSGFLLVDVRGGEEVAVSRIPGAVPLAGPGEVRGYLVEHPVRGARVVLYDSTGSRSADIAEELGGEGVAAAYLAGGIFQWANEGRPLVDPRGRPTTEVHPYNKWWGRLLKKNPPK